MKRAMLAVLALGACSSPASGLRAGPTATSTTSTTATSTPTTSEGAASESVAPSDPPVPPPPTTTAVAAPPVQPPLRPADQTSEIATGAGGTTSASWYGAESGAHTANGDSYDPAGLTFAHRTMAFGTAVRFCRNGACVVATCTDRGPASWTGRDFDLSRATFALLSPLSAGVATMTWEEVG